MRRKLIVFLLCLVTGCVFNLPLMAAESGISDEWLAAHEAGVKSYQAADYKEALSYFEKSWPLAQIPLTRGTTANEIGAALHALGRESEARPWFERSIAIWRTMPGKADEFARTALGLADADRGLSDFTA